jgi:hypothetical protein
MFLAVVSLVAAVVAVLASHNATMLAETSLERIPLAQAQATPAPPSQSMPAVVEARRFILRDNAGRMRAELGVEPDQRAELSLRAPDGALSATLATANPDDPDTSATASRLQLYDRSGRARAAIQVLAFLSGQREMQGAAVLLTDGNGKHVALLSASDSTPGLSCSAKTITPN